MRCGCGAEFIVSSDLPTPCVGLNVKREETQAHMLQRPRFSLDPVWYRETTGESAWSNGC